MLLVVAADEGVKPQTREHVDICTLLKIPHAVVVLTKKDLVEDALNSTRAAIEEGIVPGGGVALLNAVIHTIIDEGLHDPDYLQSFAEGFEELVERVRSVVDRYLLLGHRFEHRSLNFRRRSVDLVRQQQIAEHRTALVREVELAGLLPNQLGPNDVRGHQIRRKLQTFQVSEFLTLKHRFYRRNELTPEVSQTLITRAVAAPKSILAVENLS